MSQSISITDLNLLLIDSGTENVVRYLMGDNPKRTGNYLHVGNVLGDKSPDGTGSLAIYLSGAQTGYWVDNSTNESGDLVELWTRNRNLSKSDAIKQIREYLNIDNTSFTAKPHLQIVQPAGKVSVIHEEKIDPASKQNLKYLRDRLLGNEKAMLWLTNRGLDAAKAVEQFGLGLQQEKNGIGEILRVPLIDSSGVITKRSAYYPISDLTSDIFGSTPKCKGSVAWSYANARLNQKYLFICEGFKDQWILKQHIDNSEFAKDILIITSTHGTNIPQIGIQRHYYTGFERVFLGHDNDGKSDATVKKLAQAIGSRHRRLEVPDGYGKDWTDFFYAGGTVAELLQLMWNAETINLPIIESNESLTLDEYQINNDYDLTTLTISGYSYHNGFMYYPIEALHIGLTVGKTGDIEKAYGRRTRILRSGNPLAGVNPQILTFFKLPQLYADDISSTPLYALSDDTILLDKPKVATNNTFSHKAVSMFAAGKYPARNTEDLLHEIETYYRTQFYVSDDDYKLLAMITMATHCQHVFDAVPLVLATGPAGTGKSTIGSTLTRLSANATQISMTSAASILRTIDTNRGFLVIDDLEEISNEGMSDIAQALKSSYTKESAIKRVTIIKSGAATLQDINFFGIKFFSNTRGMDAETLLTRTLIIRSQKAPKNFKINNKFPENDLLKLRDDLHVWAFSNVIKIREIYETFDFHSRELQIAAPLRTIASMTSDPDIYDNVMERIMRRNSEAGDEDTPEGFLKSAVLNLIGRGFFSCAIEHVQLEMISIMPANFGKSSTTDIPEFMQNRWIKEHMHGWGWINSKPEKRARVTLNRLGTAKGIFCFTNDVKKLYTETRSSNDLAMSLDGSDFCKSTKCRECPYENLDCPFKSEKRNL